MWQDKSTPLIMGIVNVTPDSFSDGGQFLNLTHAVEHALRLSEEGADILDIGGESTRPNAPLVSLQEEMDRVLPVIEAVSMEIDTLISIDTRHTQTMREAIACGARMINDVQALQDEGAVELVAEKKIPVCLMHMKNIPQTMQDHPVYKDVVEEIFVFLQERISVCVQAGISQETICADVGIGFGKTLEHNLILLKHFNRFHDLGVSLLLGTSRKSFIGQLSGQNEPQKRVGGSIASALYGLQNGVELFRVHDVAETKEAFQIYHALAQEA